MTLDLDEYGWIKRPSGRYVHPDLPLAHGRRRVFTEAEALTITQGMIDAECPDCGTVHDVPALPEPAEA